MGPTPSIRGKAVEQPRAADPFERLHIAARRAMRRVPRHVGNRIGIRPVSVVLADEGRAPAALGPVAAGRVLACLHRCGVAVRPQASQDVIQALCRMHRGPRGSSSQKHCGALTRAS